MPTTPISIFDSIKIPTIMFIIILFVAFLILLAGAIYIFWIYHNGKSMKEFFWGRINSWFNKGYSLFQIITLMDNIIFEKANYDEKKGYERIIPTIEVKEPLNKKKFYISLIITAILIIILLYTFSQYNTLTNHPIISTILLFILSIIPLYIYFKRPTKIEHIKTERNQTPIIPLSSYTINAVDTVLLWDVHPKIPNYIKIGLETLISKSIKTLDEFTSLCDLKPNDLLFETYSNIEFLKMYLSYRNKFEVKVKIPTVYNFISKNFDENYSESIQIKEYNSAYQTKFNNNIAKYGYIIVGIFVAAIAFKIIWVTIH